MSKNELDTTERTENQRRDILGKLCIPRFLVLWRYIETRENEIRDSWFLRSNSMMLASLSLMRTSEQMT